MRYSWCWCIYLEIENRWYTALLYVYNYLIYLLRQLTLRNGKKNEKIGGFVHILRDRQDDHESFWIEEKETVIIQIRFTHVSTNINSFSLCCPPDALLGFAVETLLGATSLPLFPEPQAKCRRKWIDSLAKTCLQSFFQPFHRGFLFVSTRDVQIVERDCISFLGYVCLFWNNE